MIDFKLWAHQEDTLQKALKGNDFALLHDCGTGKTLTTIQILRHTFARHGHILSTLVLFPVIVVHNWKEEIAKFSKIPESRILPLVGATKKRVKLLQEYQDKFGDEFIAVTNYESLVSSKVFYDELLYWNPACMVIDESQRIKSYKSKRTKLVTQLADKSLYRYILTGTPILNSPMDIFAQYRALDGGRTFGHNFFEFRARYFYDENAKMPAHVHFPKWVIKPESYHEMQDLIYSKATRAVKSECLDLPPLVKQKIYVEMPPAVKKAYKSMVDNFVALIDGKVVTAEIALTKSLRMLQMVNGFVKDEDGVESSVESPKRAALKELLQDLKDHSKVLVWCAFKENYEQVRKVCDELKIKYVEAHGGISNSCKYAAVDSFNNDNSVGVFIGHPGSLGVGINLVSASYSIYFSRTFNLEHDLQSEARNYRGGSEIHAKITRIDLITKDSIDEAVMEALEGKVSVSDKLLTILKKHLT